MSTHINIAKREAEETAAADKTQLGFWIYLMTDSVLFGGLFATYVVLAGNTNGGAGGKELFNLQFVLVETIILLLSSYTIGLAVLSMKRQKIRAVQLWLIITAVLGMAFLGMELTEFGQLVRDGHAWTASAFLSAFFTLVGTHGLHITAGLIWAGVLLWQLRVRGLSQAVTQRLLLFSLFWHFLDIIWICIFTIVYLMGVL